MILRMPEYCMNFKCIADKCSDSCCIGWEIGIDNKTADYYKSIKGDFGDRLKSHISHDNKFILIKDDRCPFLNEKNLCEIIINSGESSLCQICSDHPRYYEWFDGIKEGGIGLCCEEAARIILSSTPLSFYDVQINDEAADEYDNELYKYLYTARKEIFRHIQNKNLSLSQRICDILDFSERLQICADNCEYIIPNIGTSKFSNKHNLKGILKFLITLEPIDKDWKPYIKSRINMYNNVLNHEINSVQINEHLQNISVYFIWRYFLKGVFDGEFLSRVKLMVISTAVIAYLFACCQVENPNCTLNDYALIAKNYSKEIEYNEENLIKILDASYELDCFSTECLKGIFYGGKNENCKSC